jgi:hypothetical protein
MALCERCRMDIALANEFDQDPRIDRLHIAVIVGDSYHRLSAVEWGIFGALYSARGRVVMSDDIADAVRIAPEVRENIRRLRLKLRGTGFDVVNVRGFGYLLRDAKLSRPGAPSTGGLGPAPSGRLANLQRAMCGGGRP